MLIFLLQSIFKECLYNLLLLTLVLSIIRILQISSSYFQDTYFHIYLKYIYQISTYLAIYFHTHIYGICEGRSVQSLSLVQLLVTPWTAAHQASLSITNPQSLLKLMSIQSVMPSNQLILCGPLHLLPSIFPSIRSFPVTQFFISGGQSIGASASASVLAVTIQD